MVDPTPEQVRDFREHLAEFLRRAELETDFAGMSPKNAVCLAGSPDRRPSGLLEGRIWMADDFDETPEEVIDAMEGNERA